MGDSLSEGNGGSGHSDCCVAPQRSHLNLLVCEIWITPVLHTCLIKLACGLVQYRGVGVNVL